MDGLLPRDVITCAVTEDLPHAVLHQAEESSVARAVPRRRAEYTTVRWCARQALSPLGHAHVPILKDVHGAPIWPEGIVGSLTHCVGFRAAAVARSAGVRSVGIDAEPHQPLPHGILPVISLPGERALLRRLSRVYPAVRWDRLLFSAKESIYKAWHPVEPRNLGYEDAVVTFDADGGWVADLVTTAMTPWSRLRGRWMVHQGILVTAVSTT